MLERLHLRTTLRRVLLALVVLIIAARVAAPYVIEHYVNRALSDLDGYTGRIEDVDLHLWRGAYQVEELNIEKTGGRVPVPFVSLERLDLGVNWRALFDGAIVAKVAMFRPKVNFVKGPSKAQSQTGEETDWRQKLDELVPLRVDRLLIVDGELHYRDFHARPKVDVFVDHLNVEVTNLTNSKEVSETRVAGLDVRANLMRSGAVRLRGNLDPFARQPTFEIKAWLEHLQIAQLNPFLKAYVNVDVDRGKLSLYSELEAKRGAFRGYVKPLIEDLDVLEWRKEEERPIEKIWEGLVGGVAEIFQNQPNDRLATRIPLEGRFEEPRVGAGKAIFALLRNAFIRALRHGLDTSAG
jgi:uncharacterized protein YhdP